jgi:histidine triad (HIT) family protein
LRAAKYAARKPFLLAWMLRNMSFALPLKRLSETATLLAFHHPAPGYPLHILLVPKKPIASLSALDPDEDRDFLGDLYATVQKLVRQFHLNEDGYRLIVNGGKFQDFPYLHFHLIAEQAQPSDRLPVSASDPENG